jgi:arginine decarboxylase
VAVGENTAALRRGRHLPVLAPGEIITAEVVDYLQTGAAAGMLIPDAADSSVTTLRVVQR